MINNRSKINKTGNSRIANSSKEEIIRTKVTETIAMIPKAVMIPTLVMKPTTLVMKPALVMIFKKNQ